MTEVQPREIKILETAEDIQNRRDEVLGRYGNFKQAISGMLSFCFVNELALNPFPPIDTF